MIALVVVFLLACYVLKFFFPKQFVMAIENENIVKVGNYVDNHKWLTILCACITSFITYWFYLCAVLKKWYLNWKQVLIVLAVIGATQGLYELDATLSSGFAIVSMLLLPVFFKADLKVSTVVFCIHYLAQTLSLQIRQLPMLLTSVNYATILLLMLEAYFWLILCYLYTNYKKGENKNG